MQQFYKYKKTHVVQLPCSTGVEREKSFLFEYLLQRGITKRCWRIIEILKQVRLFMNL